MYNLIVEFDHKVVKQRRIPPCQMSSNCPMFLENENICLLRIPRYPLDIRNYPLDMSSYACCIFGERDLKI